MSCLHLEQVYLYLEGELNSAERGLVERHLEHCPGCRRAVEERRILDQAARTLPLLEVSSDFSAKVLARIPGREPSSFARTLVIAAGAGTLFLTVLGAVLLMGLRLPAFLIFLSRSLWNFLGRAGAVLGKALEVLLAGLKLAGECLGGLWKVFATLFGSFLPDGTVAPALLLGTVLSLLLILRMKRLLFTGEKP